MMSMPAEVAANPTAYRFVPGKGYVHMGQLSVPSNPIAEASSCEPPALAMDGTEHMLQPPSGAEPMKLTWKLATKTWLPYLGNGRRVGFSSAYLAAHGWSYIGPA